MISDPIPRLVMGLGNPGPEYASTPHNVGFEVLDLYASRLQASFEYKSDLSSSVLELPLHNVVIAKPMLYMNLSGLCLRKLWNYYQLSSPAELLIIVDDFHLDLGAIVLKAKGSTGGHNGLLSIEETLGTDNYSRLRLGVGEPGDNSIDHVLSPFSSQSKEVVSEMLIRASFVLEDWVLGKSIVDLQAQFNRRKP
jgi:PTH1 family peptidyl-tRNA hydrolase